MPSRRKLRPRRNIVTDAIDAYDVRVRAAYKAAAQYIEEEPPPDVTMTVSEKTELTRLLAEDMIETWRRSHGQKADAIPIGGTFLVYGDMEGAAV